MKEYFIHKSVLVKEVLEFLAPEPNENFIDATFGGGGHSRAILEKVNPKGRVLAIEQEKELITKFSISNLLGEAGEIFAKGEHFQFSDRIILVCDNFSNLKNIVEKYNFKPVNGILFDLGISSWHLEKSGRGFSFQKDESLDMRLGTSNSQLTAEEILNKWPEVEIEQILREYGEERYARRIAERICQERKLKPIQSTFQLIEVIGKSVPLRYKRGRTHFARRTFQALRIAVNNELENLKTALAESLEILEPKGRLVVISFQSLEDRIVKNLFKEKAKVGHLEILTKKPIRPSEEEIKINPRSRSAKLRAAKKTKNLSLLKTKI